MSFLSSHKLLVHSQWKHVGSLVLGIHLLYVIAYGLEHLSVVEPYKVRTPLPSVNMCEERSVGGHIYHVGIAFKVGHEGCLVERCLVVVPFLSLSVAGIFAGKHFRTLAVVALVAQAMAEEPRLGAIEMLVHEVCFLAFHRFPTEVKHLAFRVRTAGANDLYLWILCADTLNKRLQALEVELVPLLVAHAEIFHVEWSWMPHFDALLSPFGIFVAISKLDEVETVLDKWL